MTKERAIFHLKDISMWGIVQADEYNALKMAIEELQKKPKMGKLIVTKEKDELYSNVCICSECGRSDVGAGDYCRWCGARMKEVTRS